MFVDSREIQPGTTREVDLCIVGAGAAGIALARALRDSHRTIALLESGGLEASAGREDLLVGRFDGHISNADDYVGRTRDRFFGGTTNRWTGTCRPLDPIDFAERSWVADSGWPISMEDLEPYYRRAAELVEIPAFEDYGENGQVHGFNMVDRLDDPRMVPKLLLRSPPTRFGTRYRAELETAERLEVFLWANVLRFKARPEHPSIESVEVAAEPGRSFEIKARAYVLATGGFDNARLLLVSDTERPGGLCNENDLVGRYYMDHTRLYRAGVWIPTDQSYRSTNEYKAAVDSVPKRLLPYTIFTPTAALQRSQRMLNCGVHLHSVPRDTSWTGNSDVYASSARLAAELDNGLLGEGLFPRDPAEPDFNLPVIKFYNEHVPLADSRVLLDSERDAFGQRRIEVRWRSTPAMDRTARQTIRLFAREFGRAGRGRVRIECDDEPPYREHGGLGGHHMGTTRMHVDPKHGVVDGNCRAHGAENLYIAGSSVFPTGGFANPTFTILALTLRLAEHLRSEELA